ncbi:GPI ethanolamine phosphate transferase 2 [Fulvia fulva]|nr:GPI ethanolamine phosphate transferase 2 [Fulvia fulva]KAK4623151.1 GPI ethanolamine phosphate transferase 2 [Fulvia fulva]WPV15765.1 GPI ethanolamine phosphate transferase 2 [Fulvia fulva]
MARSAGFRTACLTLANVLLPIAVLVFATGFFPYKPVLPGLATFDDIEVASTPPVFDRVVFMVVDALRSDFVYGHNSGFDFTQSLIRDGAAIPFTAHATPPTVTMPRVKALTTGSVPSFLDLILNFAESDTSSSLANQDTWLAQIRAKGGNLIFYGDDTWLKLFESGQTGAGKGQFFSRFDGTSSFFVSLSINVFSFLQDFTEVDNNVTRHVPEQLAESDWNAMIMHYLGLDHIGHKTGPQGPNMLPKQREMDGIVKTIYETMEKKPRLEDTLLVLAGDHGMNNGGNHGGSGPGETEPALLFASPKLRKMKKSREYECPTLPKEGTEFHYYTKIQQSDLVPTLAGLMSLPIPRNSLGVSIPELTGLLTQDETSTTGLLKEEGTTELFKRNTKQTLEIIEATYGTESFRSKVASFEPKNMPSSDICTDQDEGEPRLACLWAYVENRLATGESWRNTARRHAAMLAFLLEAQETLSGTASSYNIPRMVVGMCLSATIVALALSSFPSIWPPTTAGMFFATTSVLYGIMMFASSYVEEEQQFWYWLTPSWFIILGAKNTSKFIDHRARLRLALAVFALLAVHRFCIRWNQTGQKHAGAEDIVHTFFPREHVAMWVLILAAYVYNGFQMVPKTFGGILAPEVAVVLVVAMTLPAIVFKLNFTQADAPELVHGLAYRIRNWTSQFDLVLQARVVFFVLALCTVIVVVLSVLSYREAGAREKGLLPSLAERLHYLLTLFLMTQTRAPNIPLFLGLEVQREALGYILLGGQTPGKRPVTEVAMTTLLLSHSYYFCMGGSNSISSIDLSNAYNGVADYNIVAVGVLLFASNWTGPIWLCSAANLLLSTKPASAKQAKDSKSWIDEERKKLHQDTLRSTMGPQKVEKEDGGVWMQYISHMTVFIGASLLAVMAACTALRTHLFIWTVFSPKYLYAMAWAVGWHLLINVGVGSALRGMGGVK